MSKPLDNSLRAVLYYRTEAVRLPVGVTLHGGGCFPHYGEVENLFPSPMPRKGGGDIHGHDMGIVFPVLHADDSCNSSCDGYYE